MKVALTLLPLFIAASCHAMEKELAPKTFAPQQANGALLPLSQTIERFQSGSNPHTGQNWPKQKKQRTNQTNPVTPTDNAFCCSLCTSPNASKAELYLHMMIAHGIRTETAAKI